ncbi:hypothetical protein Cal7507_0739 [Calothrix sp. PCC 7507]|nr:hypothetical protein Cal7507_0739 [Calothrix sp. PCC 7507]
MAIAACFLAEIENEPTWFEKAIALVCDDYNLNQQAILTSGSLVAEGWLDISPIRLVTFVGCSS